jgi:general secretion pathway protein A
MLGEFEKLLVERRRQGETTVLIVDEAQSLPLDLLEEIRLLANIETNDEKLLSVIIAGQPELATRLNNADLRQLKQRIALRCELRSLKRSETDSYLAGRIRAAGGVASHVLTREAVGLIFEAAHGLPRTINVIADNALLGGFAAGVRPVGSDIVAEVCRDFDLLKHAQEQSPRVVLGSSDNGPGVVGAKRPSLVPTPSTNRIFGAAADQDAAVADGTRGASSDFSNRRRRFSFFWN